MRKFLWSVIFIGVLYGGYWFVGARAAQNGAVQFIGQLRDDGYEVGYDALNMAGFPNRFDMTFTQPEIFSPQTGYGWQADFAQFFSLSYKPWHIIAVLAHDQLVNLPDQEIKLTNSDMRASLELRPQFDLPLQQAFMQGKDIQFASDQGWQLKAAKANAGLIADGDTAYIAALSLHEVMPDPSWLNLPPDDPLHHAAIGLDVKLRVQLDRPLALRNAARPVVQKITVQTARLKWWEIDAGLSGSLAPDASGALQGELKLTVLNWRSAYEKAALMGVIPVQMKVFLENTLAQYSKQVEGGEMLDIAMVFDKGFARLGNIPLGPAPRL